MRAGRQGLDAGLERIPPSVDASAAASKDLLLSLQWYLAQRKVRADLVEPLLDAAAIAPKGHPSPADVLAAVITGLHEPGPAVVGHVATLDVTETGACGPAWVRTCVCV